MSLWDHYKAIKKIFKKNEPIEQDLQAKLSFKDNDGRYRRSQRGRGRGRGRGFLHGQGRGCGQQREENQKDERLYETKNSRRRGRGRYIPRYEKSNSKCYSCQKYAHYACECRTSKYQLS